jgi:hypothetical protein
MSIATMNRLSYASLAEFASNEKEKQAKQVYTAIVVIRQNSVTVTIQTLAGQMRTRRQFNGVNLDACQALFKQFNVSKIYWS